MQNNTGNFALEDEQAVIVLKINSSSPFIYFFFLFVLEFMLTEKKKNVLFVLGTLLTTHSPAPVAPHPVTMPTYRAPGTPTYSYVPPQW